MILVSFSLYGSSPKYLVGAVKNADFIQKLGNDWQAVFYLGPEVKTEVELELKKFGAWVRRWEPHWHQNGMFWRFSAVCDYEFDFIIIRDVDSRISQRELNCLNDWFASGKVSSIIRDHPFHNALILGGLWGVSSKVKDLSIEWKNSENYGDSHGQDQAFLHKEVFPKIKKSIHLNDAFFSLPRSKYRFPTPRIGSEFVGESVDENEIFDDGLRYIVDKYMNSKFLRTLILIKFYLHKLK